MSKYCKSKSNFQAKIHGVGIWWDIIILHECIIGTNPHTCSNLNMKNSHNLIITQNTSEVLYTHAVTWWRCFKPAGLSAVSIVYFIPPSHKFHIWNNHVTYMTLVIDTFLSTYSIIFVYPDMCDIFFMFLQFLTLFIVDPWTAVEPYIKLAGHYFNSLDSKIGNSYLRTWQKHTNDTSLPLCGH